MINDFIDTHLLQLQILGQVALAMLLGALIGFDREFSKKPAGLRTHMLVAGAAGLIVKLAELAIIQFEGISGLESLRFDPIRVFVAVVTGVSFLGAGTIIRQGQDNRVEGLTTNLKNNPLPVIKRVKISRIKNKEKTLSDRKEYIERMSKQLKSWDDQIIKLEEKAAGVNKETKEKYRNELFKLKKQENNTRQKLEELKKSGDEAWDDLKKGFEKSWSELSSAFENAHSGF
ncbi:MAG: MgtC/SapB family protein [Calditrichaceae bacterium]